MSVFMFLKVLNEVLIEIWMNFLIFVNLLIAGVF